MEASDPLLAAGEPSDTGLPALADARALADRADVFILPLLADGQWALLALERREKTAEEEGAALPSAVGGGCSKC